MAFWSGWLPSAEGAGGGGRGGGGGGGGQADKSSTKTLLLGEDVQEPQHSKVTKHI